MELTYSVPYETSRSSRPESSTNNFHPFSIHLRHLAFEPRLSSIAAGWANVNPCFGLLRWATKSSLVDFFCMGKQLLPRVSLRIAIRKIHGHSMSHFDKFLFHRLVMDLAIRGTPMREVDNRRGINNANNDERHNRDRTGEYQQSFDRKSRLQSGLAVFLYSFISGTVNERPQSVHDSLIQPLPSHALQKGHRQTKRAMMEQTRVAATIEQKFRSDFSPLISNEDAANQVRVKPTATSIILRRESMRDFCTGKPFCAYSLSDSKPEWRVQRRRSVALNRLTSPKRIIPRQVHAINAAINSAVFRFA
jgi:hypothetical protein